MHGIVLAQLLAIILGSASAMAATFEFTAVVREADLIPDGGGAQFEFIGSPVLSGNYVAFSGQTTSNSQFGIYLKNLATGTLTTVVDNNSLVPGSATEHFDGFSSYGIENDSVVFNGSGDDDTEGVFIRTGAGPIIAIATNSSNLPNSGGETFTGFQSVIDDGFRIANGEVVFPGFGVDSDGFGVSGIYRWTGSGYSVIADDSSGSQLGTVSGTPLPAFDGSHASFLAGPYFSGAESGIYRWNPSTGYTKIALAGGVLPGGGFLGSLGLQDIDGGTILFGCSINGSPADGSSTGLFLLDGSGISTFVRSADSTPGTAVPYGFVSNPASRDGAQAFLGSNGLYTTVGGTASEPIQAVIESGDPIDGGTLSIVNFRPGGLDNGRLVFDAFLGAGICNIYLAELAAPDPIIPVITITRPVNDVLLEFATETGFDYDIEINTDPGQYSWHKVGTVTGDDSTQTFPHTPPVGPDTLLYRLSIHPTTAP